MIARPAVRLIGGISLGLILLLVLHLIWGAVAERRLAREVAAAREDVEALSKAPPPRDGPDSDNAVPLLMQAFAALNANAYSPSQSNMEYPNYPPFSAEWHKLADAAVAANATPLRLLRDARAKGRVEWPFAPTAAAQAFGQFGNGRSLAMHAGDAALRDHLNGNDVEALERCRDLLFLASAIDRQRTLVSHLVASGIRAVCINRILVIAPGLKLRPDEDDALGRSVRRLTAQLCDESAHVQGMRDAVLTDRAIHVTHVSQGFDEVWVTRPMFKLDLARLLAADRAMIAAATQPTLAAARAMMKHVPQNRHRPTTRTTADVPRFTREISDAASSSLRHWLEAGFRHRLEGRFAAISLAAQLYRADHGRWPARLEELAPAYLESVPVDTLAANASAIGYAVLKRDDGEPRPIIFSTGPDGVLDTPGDFSRVPPEPQYNWIGTRKPFDDQFRDLSRWDPAAR